MTVLEKVLGSALAVVSSAYVYTLVTSIKHNKSQMEAFAEIEEKLINMGQVLKDGGVGEETD